MFDVRRMAALLICVPSLLALGCRFNTAPYRAPRDAVRVIETLDLPERAPTGPEQAQAADLPTTLPSTQPLAQRPLTLAEVRELALRHNLELQIVRLDPEIAREDLRAEEAAFESVFTTSASYAWLDQPIGGTVVDGRVVGSRVDVANLEPGIFIPLRTGGNVILSLPMQRRENKTDFGDGSGPDTTYETDFSATYNQPLARDFGEDANALGIRLATVAFGQAQARQKVEVINILAAADRNYWLLYAAQRAQAVQREQYDLAVGQLARAQRQVDAGAQPQVEVIRAQSDVADALELLIQAENLVRERVRALKRILNAPELQLEGATSIIPETLPAPVLYELETGRLIDVAMNRRMELLEAELAIAAETARVLASRNATLPRVDLRTGWNVNGAGDSLSDSFDQTGTLDFQDYNVGVNVEVPLGNMQARSRYRAALLRRLQALATRESRILEIKQQVLDAADRLQTAWHRVIAARRRVVLSARLLEAETRRFDLGENTTLDVSTARTNLAQAQRAEIEALTEYEIARVELAVATGTVIGKDRIVLEE